ncbi:MAG TPA: alpha/beta hydrolase [Acidimicrobiales bacterium]|nr:alpha/beta hydrolase [Acidimicrobiales bacterium]
MDTAETVVDLPFGPCEVRRTGVGAPVLLVHGILVNGSIWDAIVPGLAVDHQVIQPDLPLGAHRVHAERRDLLTPEVVADSLGDLLDALGHEEAVVVGNDTGGAIAQLFTARHPDRVRALVLTSCDAFDHFPPTVLKPVKPLLAVPGMIDLFGLLYRSRRIRRSWMGAGLILREVDDDLIAPYFDRIAHDRESRRDMARFVRGCRPALTNAAADALSTFPRPVLLAWSAGDVLFPEADARRLAEMIPDAELTWIRDSRTFSMVDQPEQLLAAVRPFLERLPA